MNNKKIIGEDESLGEWCERTDNLQLLEMYDTVKNRFSPYTVKHGMGKVNWRCKEGHSWEASVNHTIRGYGCPYCNSNLIINHYNDFRTFCINSTDEVYKQILDEWDYENNNIHGDLKGLNLSNVDINCPNEFYWLTKDGYSVKSTIKSRLHTKRLANGKKSMKSFKAYCEKNNKMSLLSEWENGNNEFAPSEIPISKHVDINWVCSKCGGSFTTQAINRIENKRNDCPYCTGKELMIGYNDFQTYCLKNRPELLKQWDYDKNTIKPDQITYKSSENIYWNINNEYFWQEPINNRINKKNGPDDTIFELWCHKTNREDLLNEWAYSLNTIKPNEINKAAKEMVWWKCPEGHIYKSRIGCRTRASRPTGCPICNNVKISTREKIVAFYLKKYFDIEENYRPDWLDGMELDIYIPSLKIGIEYDGQAWHKKKDRDIKKNKLCNNIKLIRIREPECGDIDNCKVYKLDTLSESDLEKILIQLLKDIGIDNPDVNINRDRAVVLKTINQKKLDNSLETWCKENNREDILEEYDIEANLGLLPTQIARFSGKIVYWKINGELIQKSVANITQPIQQKISKSKHSDINKYIIPKGVVNNVL